MYKCDCEPGLEDVTEENAILRVSFYKSMELKLRFVVFISPDRTI